VLAQAVGEVVRATVRILRPITECITVAKSAEYWDGAAVLAARAALQGGVMRLAVVPGYFPVGVGPRRGLPHHLHRGDGADQPYE